MLRVNTVLLLKQSRGYTIKVNIKKRSTYQKDTRNTGLEIRNQTVWIVHSSILDRITSTRFSLIFVDKINDIYFYLGVTSGEFI